MDILAKNILTELFLFRTTILLHLYH